jgi:hypothetical protein
MSWKFFLIRLTCDESVGKSGSPSPANLLWGVEEVVWETLFAVSWQQQKIL